MLFNSFSFLIFFPVACLVYWALPARMRNVWLLLASYYFYMCWQPLYAFLMLFTTASTWACTWGMEHVAERGRRVLMTLAVVANLGVLFLFKYQGFFAENVSQMLSWCGLGMTVPRMELLLPVGISFYTFQSIGYVTEVYRRREHHIRNFFHYALFIAFFPQLVAGPIETTQHMMPQFRQPHKLLAHDVKMGLLMMLWGYFMKVCMADVCGVYVDAVFDNLYAHNGGSYLLATLLFTFQIYGDFCGYSMIALGAARVMGFRMTDNFNNPYFSTSISIFWGRWHITLSNFLRENVYIPLGGSRCGRGRTCLNLLITMLLSGLWHGANWTYVLWGLLHGACMCVERILGINRDSGRSTPWRILRILATFALVCMLWVFFRSASLADAWTVWGGIFCRMGTPFVHATVLAFAFFSIAVVLVKDLLCEMHSPLKNKLIASNAFCYCLTVLTVCFILLFGVLESSQFIYFQF